MRILALPSDAAGCGHYRIRQPIKTLLAQEADISVDIERGFPAIQSGDKLVGIRPEVIDAYDVVIMQRPMTDWQLDAIGFFQQAGVAVAIELDDDFAHVHPANTVLRTVTPIHRANLRKACLQADLVTVTTPALAKLYAPHGRVVVLPNYISADWLQLDDRDREGNVVGWSGTVATHPNDLQAAYGGVASALEATDARFRVIGRPELVQRNLKLSRPPELAPWVPIELYPHELAKLDVGIAPLANTVFNRAKSWLKPLELAAAGVPVVMSDVGEYRQLADAGIGLLASSHHDWQAHIIALIKDVTLRLEVANLSRQVVREGFLIEQHAWRWAEAWSEAIANRHMRAKCAA